ncbi:MAG: hypothetical protein FJ256_05785 [Phycisphaerae bacterium]|nr:hypothetical protein [Phycisphaerae bacterium]
MSDDETMRRIIGGALVGAIVGSWLRRLGILDPFLDGWIGGDGVKIAGAIIGAIVGALVGRTDK